MPARLVPLVTNEYYHIFNRGINKQPIFLGRRDYKRALDLLKYYSFTAQKLRFSKFLLLSRNERANFSAKLPDNSKLVDCISYCFMPNHFHFLLHQRIENGISKFMSIYQNSYTRFFNTKYKKIGPILQGQFKAVRVEDDNQLLHLSRYIHLNPYSSFVIKEISQLENYLWSSYPEYINVSRENVCKKEIILSQFSNENEYKTYVFNHADYQRKLEEIKHLTIESK